MMRREKYASFGISLSVSTSVMRYLAAPAGKEAVKHISAQKAARRAACWPCWRHQELAWGIIAAGCGAVLGDQPNCGQGGHRAHPGPRGP